MDFHISTLFLAASLTNLVASVFLVRWFPGSPRGVVGPWAGFAACEALANFSIAQSQAAAPLGTLALQAPQALMRDLHLVAGPAAALLGLALLWRGMRRLRGKELAGWVTPLPMAFWLLVATLPQPFHQPAPVIFGALSLLLLAGATRDAWLAHRERKLSAALDMAILLMLACLWAGSRLAEAVASVSTPISDVGSLFNLLFAATLPFLAIATAREAAGQSAGLREAAAAREGRDSVGRLLTGLPAVIFQRAVAPDGTSRTLFRGGNAEATTGLGPEILNPESNWVELAAPGTFDEREAQSRTLAEGRFSREWALRRPDGRLIWLRTDQRLLARLPDGGFEFAGYHLNITAERAAAAELQDTLTAVPAIVHRGFVTAEGLYTRTWLSRGVEGVTGWPWEAVNPRGGMQGLIHADDQAASQRQWRDVLRDGAAEGEYRLLNARHEWMWVRTKSVVLQRRPDGGAETISFVVDVTEARAAREREAAALREGREQVERLHAGLPAIIFLREVAADGSSQLRYRGGDIEEVTGWPTAEFEALAAASEWPGVPPETFQTFMATVLSEEHAVTERDLPDAKGERRWLRLHCRLLSPLPDGGATVVGYMSNITSERRAEAQAAANNRLLSLGEMASGLAHELRQPLTSLSLAAEIAQMQARRTHDAELERRLEVIVAQAHRASEIIEMLRRFARGPDAVARYVPIDLMEVMSTLSTLSGAALQDAGITLELALGTPPAMPLGDRTALEQVLTNLVMNARDAIVGAGKERRIRISATRNGSEVILTVSDTGGGLPPSVLARAFQPFVTTKGPDRGTGLGLSICYGLVRSMGGRITVANGPEGAVFTVALPAAITEAEPVAAGYSA